MDAVRIAGRPDDPEVAAVLAVLGRERPAREPDPVQAWRVRRRVAVRRTAQQTR